MTPRAISKVTLTIMHTCGLMNSESIRAKKSEHARKPVPVMLIISAEMKGIFILLIPYDIDVAKASMHTATTSKKAGSIKITPSNSIC